ncbi:MAG: helix-turn-helix domain-containing protein [Clostridia bacterium]|nr:helix-turn-helix domain-containing protein [Clostridia bacterium]
MLDLRMPEMCNFFVKFYHDSSQGEKAAKEYLAHVDDMVELYVLEEGDVSFFVGGSLYRLEAGDVILSKPNEVHNCIQNSTGIHRHYCFWFSPLCTPLMTCFIEHEDGRGNLIRLGSEEKKELLSICEKIEKKTVEGDTISAFSCAVAMLELCRGGLAEEVPSHPLPSVLLTVIDRMNEDIGTVSSIEEICKEYFISHSTLLRMFRRYLGVSPHAYLEARRLAMARTYLKEGRSVSEVADLTGFADVSAFIRLFRSRFSMTPRQYKQLNSKTAE